MNMPIKAQPVEVEEKNPLVEEKKDEEIVDDEIVEDEEIVDDEKDASFYKAEAERLAAEKKKAEEDLAAEKAERLRQNKIKDDLLKVEKDRRKKAETAKDGEFDPEALKREAVDEFERRQSLRDAKKLIATLTDDPSAREVITHHVETTFANIEDVDDRVNAAIAFANRGRARTFLANKAEEDADDDAIDSLRGGNARGMSDDSAVTRSKKFKDASSLVSSDKAKKYLKKHLS